MTDHQAEHVRGAGGIGAQRVVTQCDLIAEQRGHLEGVACATEEPQRRCPPGRGPAVGIEARGGGQVLCEHGGAQLGPGRLAEGVVLGDREELVFPGSSSHDADTNAPARHDNGN